MDDDFPPQRSSMPAFIVVFLLVLFAVACLAPMFIPNIKPMEAEWKQTLINSVIASIAYFIGTTNQSAKKDETIAASMK